MLRTKSVGAISGVAIMLLLIDMSTLHAVYHPIQRCKSDTECDSSFCDPGEYALCSCDTFRAPNGEYHCRTVDYFKSVCVCHRTISPEAPPAIMTL